MTFEEAPLPDLEPVLETVIAAPAPTPAPAAAPAPAAEENMEETEADEEQEERKRVRRRKKKHGSEDPEGAGHRVVICDDQVSDNLCLLSDLGSI